MSNLNTKCVLLSFLSKNLKRRWVLDSERCSGLSRKNKFLFHELELLDECNMDRVEDISRTVFISHLLTSFFFLNSILTSCLKVYVIFNNIVAFCFFNTILLAKNAKVKKANQNKTLKHRDSLIKALYINT